MYYIRVKEGKNEKLKAKFNSHLHSTLCLPDLKTLALKGAEKSETEISIGEKEKWTNKGTDKQYVAVCLLHNTTHHSQALYQISES